MRPVFITLLASALAAALPSSSVLDAPLPPGRHELGPRDVREIARLAGSVKPACSVLGDAWQVPLGGEEHDMLAFSGGDTQGVNMSWYMAYTPRTDVLSIAFSSLPAAETEGFLATLAEDDGILPPLLPLPHRLFPTTLRPLVHTAFLPALEVHGALAVQALQEMLVYDRRLEEMVKIEITGHGLGAATGLLVAAALRSHVRVPIEATLFALPRVGDRGFAAYLDTLGLTLRRVTTPGDRMVDLPPRSAGLVHPHAVREVFVGKEATVCVPAPGEEVSPLCDREGEAGAVAGVWIGGCA